MEERIFTTLGLTVVTLVGAWAGNRAMYKMEQKKKSAHQHQQTQPQQPVQAAEPVKTVNGTAAPTVQYTIDQSGYWRDANGNLFQLNPVQQPVVQQPQPVVVAG